MDLKFSCCNVCYVIFLGFGVAFCFIVLKGCLPKPVVNMVISLKADGGM